MRRRATYEEYKQGLEMLAAGYAQTGEGSIAEMLGRPRGTVGRWAAEWKNKGILHEDNSIDWKLFDRWAKEKGVPHAPSDAGMTSSRHVKTEPQKSDKTEYDDVMTKPNRDVGRSMTYDMTPFDKNEIQQLKEVARWWKDRRQPEQVIEGDGPRGRYSFRLEKNLYEGLRERAQQEGKNITDLVREALWSCLRH